MNALDSIIPFILFQLYFLPYNNFPTKVTITSGIANVTNSLEKGTESLSKDSRSKVASLFILCKTSSFPTVDLFPRKRTYVASIRDVNI